MSRVVSGMTLRADAARNRAALVEAARGVFAEQGLDAPLDEVARRAGIGNATLQIETAQATADHALSC